MPTESLPKAKHFCSCVKKVTKSLKKRGRGQKERNAIGICVKTVLQTRGKTLKKFSCRKKVKLVTQSIKKNK